MASSFVFKRVPVNDVKALNLDPVDDATRAAAADIIGKVRGTEQSRAANFSMHFLYLGSLWRRSRVSRDSS